jgi:hypothetical protein
MSQEDRDWYRQEQKRRKQLVWNDQRGELEFDHGQTKRRGWRKLRQMFRVPDWIAESFRLFAWVAAIYGLWWVYRYLVEPFIFR